MKPVFLRFSGLNSYVEEQRIDFLKLLGTGVFGIFGPTGSGKSTILDAITLALYGSVARATRHTQGIMNQYVDQLHVAYTFQLSDSVQRRYRVERVFRRGASAESVEAAYARLLELDCGAPGKEGVLNVLADKPTAVTTQVEQVLGLGLTDFTRAVVLPQGKFAEFLSLRGGERRDMLQRLFGLEMYGDGLSQRVRERLQQEEAEMNAVQAACSELGDASGAALEAARERAYQAEERSEREAARTARVEEEHAVWQHVWERQAELAQLEMQEAKLSARRPSFEAAKKELQDAERAERLRAPLGFYREARAEVESARHAEQMAGREAQEAGRLAQDSRLRRQRAEHVYATESPGLYQKQAELRRAVELEKKRAHIAKILSIATEDARKQGEQLSALEAAGCEATGKATQAKEALARTREEIARRVIDPEERIRVTGAAAALHRWGDALKLLESAESDLTKCKQNLEQLERNAAQAEMVAAGTQRDHDRLRLRQEEHLRAKPCEPEELDFRRTSLHRDVRVAEQVWMLHPGLAKAESALRGLEIERKFQNEAVAKALAQREEAEAALSKEYELLQQARGKLDLAQTTDMAASLAKQLRAGMPCPVCGSIEHPVIASSKQESGIESALLAVRERELRLEQAREALQVLRDTYVRESSRLQATEDLLAKAGSEHRHLQREMERIGASLPEGWRYLDVEDLRIAVRQEEQSLSERELSLRRWQHLEHKWEEELRELTVELAEAGKQLAVAVAARDTGLSTTAEAAARVAEARHVVDGVKAELDGIRGSFPIDQIERTAARFAGWDRELIVLRQKASSWEAAERAARDLVEECRRAAEAVRRDQALTEQRKRDALSQDRQLEAEIAALAGPDANPEKDLEDAATHLQDMAEARNAAIEAEGVAEARLQKALQTLAGASERLDRAVGWEANAESALQDGLRDAGFRDQREAEAALRSDDERQRLEALTSAYYKEFAYCQGERERLERELGGRSLSAGQWRGWQERFAQARAVRDAALQESAVAASAYRDLAAKHARWQLLTRKAAALADSIGRLRDLRALFMGGAFVDFMAEQQLRQVALDASLHLGQLTRYRYALEVTSEGGFVVRDDANGGHRRPVHTLSGGETFLTSLALALSLSTQIQLCGRYPLQFFFLDEGFGSLDEELLDAAMIALERLHLAKLHVGVISHVAELRNRLARRVLVHPAVPGVRGSRLEFC